jgi:hypothetical protein
MILLLLLAALAEEVQAPVYKDGTCWRYEITRKNFLSSSSAWQDGTFDMCYEKGETVLFYINAGKRILDTNETNTLLKRMIHDPAYTSERRYIYFPFKTGDKFKGQYQEVQNILRGEIGRRAVVKYSIEGRVKDYDDQKKCYRFEREDEGPFAVREIKYCYSPDAGAIIEYEIATVARDGSRSFETTITFKCLVEPLKGSQ